jgi:hypothetical protein
MSFIVGDDGQLEVGPDENDPVRAGNARRVHDLAYEQEMRVQMDECFDSRIGQLEAAVRQLAETVAMLEQLLTGVAA